MSWRSAMLMIAFSTLACLARPASAGPVLLYDTEGDRVLYAEDADHPWFAASLTKMMTAYVVFDAWKNGRASKTKLITVSAKANAQPKMRLGLGTGKEISFDDAVKALIMKSANDIAYALAEAVSGSEEAFVAEMNATAAKLGMVSTRFINPHGLPGEGQHTTAKDMARLAAALMRDYPEHLGYFSLTMTEVGEKKKKMIATHNPVLVGFEGGDGFKTGFTCSAGYNIVASASRNGRRIVVVVLGEESSAKRAIKTKAMLEYGFEMLGWKALFQLPTIHSLPDSTYDREKVIAANLDQRLAGCKDPEPPTEDGQAIASNAKPDGTAADGKGDAAADTAAATVASHPVPQAAGAVATGSIKPGEPVKTLAVAPPAGAAPASKPAAGKALPIPTVAAVTPGVKPAAVKPGTKPAPVAAAMAPAPLKPVAPKVKLKINVKPKPAKRSPAGDQPFSLSP